MLTKGKHSCVTIPSPSCGETQIAEAGGNREQKGVPLASFRSVRIVRSTYTPIHNPLLEPRLCATLQARGTRQEESWLHALDLTYMTETRSDLI